MNGLPEWLESTEKCTFSSIHLGIQVSKIITKDAIGHRDMDWPGPGEVVLGLVSCMYISASPGPPWTTQGSESCGHGRLVKYVEMYVMFGNKGLEYD